MSLTIKQNIILLGLFSGLLLVFATAVALTQNSLTVSAQSDVKQEFCRGVKDLKLPDNTSTQTTAVPADQDQSNTQCGQAAKESGTKVNSLITNVVNIFSIVVGIIAVIMIIWGGFKYITSGGDAGRIGSAKSTIIYAIIGLIIVTLAQVIVRFVIGKSANLPTGS